ncbi:hypothetical protein [Sediminibacterium sp.]|uniref:hypothetical protein n=1 Tax=Sediminibacterium sp. TaxID=1917865 RepID=UPI003F6F236A
MDYTKNDFLKKHESDKSFKDLIDKINDVILFIKTKFLKLFIFGITGGLIGFFIAYNATSIYSARVKFLMKESGGTSALLSSLGNLGSLIGGGSNTVSPMDRTLAIIGSERIVGAALLEFITVDNNADLAVNHFIRIQELHKNWKKDTLLNDILFNKNQTRLEDFDFRHRKAYKLILNMLIGEKSKILFKSFDKKSGVFELSINTKDESFSIEFSKLIYNELEQFMYNQSVSISSKNVNILSNKLDSIKSELNGVQNSLARTNDRTLGLLMQEDRVDQKKLMMKEQMLTIMYGEAQKNLETFRFLNESTVVGLEVIEYPFSPIKPKIKSKIIFLFIGFVIGIILGFGFLYGRNWLLEQL